MCCAGCDLRTNVHIECSEASALGLTREIARSGVINLCQEFVDS